MNSLGAPGIMDSKLAARLLWAPSPGAHTSRSRALRESAEEPRKAAADTQKSVPLVTEQHKNTLQPGTLYIKGPWSLWH